MGAFGYDLLFQFDPIRLQLPRTGQKDLHLFLCDDIYFMDRKKEQIERYQYDFDYEGLSTLALDRSRRAGAPGRRAGRRRGHRATTRPKSTWPRSRRCARACVAATTTKWCCARLSARPTPAKPPTCSAACSTHSPSPYEFFLQFGDEQLVGASPEMFVRIEGRRVETCPISGTARRTRRSDRGRRQHPRVADSAKDESELTMCTDVDRNDKSRVSVPGSVKVIGRRLIESYAGLFHTVDHVEGTLKPGFDSLDAFLSHMWAVTVIGAPKKAAAQAIEDLEKDARGWYGGAVGMLALNGDINTGIPSAPSTSGTAWPGTGAGATLLYDSVPEMEAQETRLKATDFFRALAGPPRAKQAGLAARPRPGEGVRLLLVDNDDCFIHTLANYARQTGAEVVTYRAGFPLELIARIAPNLILISPGPGRPADFGVPQLVLHAAQAGIPVFGVCLGLQGMVEAFGGKLGVLGYPMHGKPSTGDPSRGRRFRGSAGALQGGPLPLAVRPRGHLSGLPGGDRGVR